MPRYAFRCKQCGAREDVTCTYDEFDSLSPPACTHGPMQRDYRAEEVAPATARLKDERENGSARDRAELFLPTAKDYESPTDPDGSKGLTKWADEHQPAEGNNRPIYPADMPKKSFAVSSGKKDK